MPGRMPTQEIDRPADPASVTAFESAPSSIAPPSIDALTVGGNGAMSRLMSGLPADPLQSTDAGDTPLPDAAPVTESRVPDAPPDPGAGSDSGAGSGTDAGSGGPVAAGPGIDGGAGPDSGAPQVAGGGRDAGGPGPVADASGAGKSGPDADGPVGDADTAAPGPVAAAAIDPILVDDELAEHERWGAAAATVGLAGSAERAGWIAETVGDNVNSSALMAMGTGAALELGTRAAARLAVRRFPAPLIGSVIGGVFSLGALIQTAATPEERAKLQAAYDAIGTGTGYERAANDLEAVATGLDLLGNLIDVIGLVAGGIAIWGWAAAVPTLGASMTFGGPATAIATAAAVASGLIAAVKIGLQSLVLVFRALHEFDSQADPRAVLKSGDNLADAAGNVGGALGGFVGTAVAGKGADAAGLVSDPNKMGSRAAADAASGRASRHPDGPFVEVGPRVEATVGDADLPPIMPEPRTVLTADEFALADRVAAATAANPNGTVLGADGQVAAGGPLPGAAEPQQLVDLQGKPLSTTPVMEGEPAVDLPVSTLNQILTGEIDDPKLARRIAHLIQDDPVDASTVRPRSILDPDPTPGDLRTAIGGMAGTPTHKDLIKATFENPGVPGVGYGHASYLLDADGNPLPVSDGNRNLGPFRGETGTAGTDPETGRQTWDADAKLHLPGTGDHAPKAAYGVRVGKFGNWFDHVFDGPDPVAARKAAIAHARDRALAGADAIADDSALPRGWAPRNHGDKPWQAQPIKEMSVYELDPATPRVVSTVAPQPEGSPGLWDKMLGRTKVYPGGGPQTEVPGGTAPVGGKAKVSFSVGSGFMDRRADGVLGTAGDVNDATGVAGLGAKVINGSSAPQRPDQRRMEPVNPAYKAPPGTPEQLAQLRREIGEMLVCRQQADADAASARADRAVTARRGDQLVSVAASVDSLARGTSDQRSAVTDTAAANRQQQGKQAQAGASLGTVAARTSGFGTLQGLLGTWGGMSSAGGKVASFFGAEETAAKMLQMAADSQRFRQQLSSLDGFIGGQAAQQPAQADKLAGDSAALSGEAARTAATGASVQRSGQQVDAIDAHNAADAAAAADAETRAVKDSTDAAVSAAEAQARHDQLAADLMAWAQQHREDRRVAVEATVARLKADGYEVVGGSYW